jgi:hypothetical protein
MVKELIKLRTDTGPQINMKKTELMTNSAETGIKLKGEAVVSQNRHTKDNW